MVVSLNQIPKVANALFNELHEEEVDIVNELYNACEKQDVAEADKLMDLLFYHLEEHFSTEERLMREAGFFAYPMHKAEHDSMRKAFGELYERWKSEKDTKAVMDFIKERFVPWFILHIATFDTATAMHIGD
ncbi:MAG: bacteriohemerythrin [Aquificota bacterium]|nr:MAG: bacteriohemerythrin [Aquificota bacterium]